jgi:hypothetical protein
VIGRRGGVERSTRRIMMIRIRSLIMKIGVRARPVCQIFPVEEGKRNRTTFERSKIIEDKSVP